MTTQPDPRVCARLAAEWEVRRLGLDNGCTTGLTVDSLTPSFMSLIDELADFPEMQRLCAWRLAAQREAAGDQHA